MCPGTSELVGQQPPPISMSDQRMEIVNRRTNRNRDGAGGRKVSQNQLNKQNWGHGKRVEKVAHLTTSMARVQNPAKRFGKSIGNREDTRDMSHNDILGFSPVLNGKVLDINMTRMFSGDTVVDHIDCRHVVFVEWGHTILWVAKFQEDGTQVFGVFSCCDSSKKLSFGA